MPHSIGGCRNEDRVRGAVAVVLSWDWRKQASKQRRGHPPRRIMLSAWSEDVMKDGARTLSRAEGTCPAVAPSYRALGATAEVVARDALLRTPHGAVAVGLATPHDGAARLYAQVCLPALIWAGCREFHTLVANLLLHWRQDP